MRSEFFKHLLIRTPLEAPATWLRELLHRREIRKEPGLAAVISEHSHIHKLLPRFITPTSNCIDIGCHLGSVLAAFCRLAPKGSHHGVEPVPYKAAWLRRKFPDVTLHQAALDAQPGVAHFHHFEGKSGHDSLKVGENEKSLAAETFEVKVETLDNLLPPNHRVDFIKIDVEGAEYGLFRGARRTLTQWHPTIVFECTATGLAAFNVQPVEVFNVLRDMGYDLFTPADLLAGGKPLDAQAFTTAMVFPFRAFNFFAVNQAKVSAGTGKPIAAAARA
jgi:FkbM family methyltransferase